MEKYLLDWYKNLNLSKRIQIFIQRLLNDQFLIGVTGVIFNKNNEVLLFKHSYRRIEWSLPGGYLKSSEHPKKGLAREIKEESGFDVKIIKIITTIDDSETARLDLSYYGEFVDGNFIRSNEVTDYKFFPLDQLPSLIDDQYKQIAEGHKRYINSQKPRPFSFIKKLFKFR